MPKRIIKRWLPDPDNPQGTQAPATLWQAAARCQPLASQPALRRRRLCGRPLHGLGPLPARCCWRWRRHRLPGQPALSVVLVWLSNPFTMPPMFYGAYLTGCQLLGQPSQHIEITFTWAWLVSVFETVAPPLLLGSLVLALLSALDRLHPHSHLLAPEHRCASGKTQGGAPMLNRWLARFKIDPDTLRQQKWFALFGERLLTPPSGRGTRALCGAVAAGLFASWVPMPMHSPGGRRPGAGVQLQPAAGPLAVWFNNPLTLPFMYLYAYRTGCLVLNETPAPSISPGPCTGWSTRRPSWCPLPARQPAAGDIDCHPAPCSPAADTATGQTGSAPPEGPARRPCPPAACLAIIWPLPPHSL